MTFMDIARREHLEMVIMILIDFAMFFHIIRTTRLISKMQDEGISTNLQRLSWNSEVQERTPS